MRIPESSGDIGPLGNLGSTLGYITAADRSVSEDIAHAVSKPLANFCNRVICCTAMRAGVTPILHQRDLRIDGAENVIPRLIDRAVKPAFSIR
jgi:hypothetical protein